MEHPESSGKREMNIYLEIMGKVPLSMERSARVSDVKEMIKNYDFSKVSKELFLSGEKLMNHRTLVESGIKEGSVLNLFTKEFGIQISIQFLSNKERTIVLEGRISDTIKDIKAMIQTNEGFLSNELNLLYNGELLDDDTTLSSLTVKNAVTFYLVSTPKQVLSISVKVPNGLIVKLKVKTCFTIQDIKTMVGSMCGISVSDWYLTLLNGKQLEDSNALACYEIRDGSMLDLRCPRFHIYLKAITSKTFFILDVDPLHTIEAVKLMAIHKMKSDLPSHFWRILFEGRLLEDSHCLLDYNIQNGSTLLFCQSCAGLSLWH